MNFDDIRGILDLVKEHELAEFELEVEGFKIKVRKPGGTPALGVPAGIAYASPLPSMALPAPASGGAPAARPADARASADLADPAGADLAIVTSPIVGTFYHAPEPNAPPFVEKGARVKKGQVLCIIEAMKLMNEIECDYEGEVVAVYVENGRPVQYGERLFAIKVS
jgi:acetyl-CoA carboxylase biotin carboxyl carrier protein